MSFCPECGEENPKGSKFCRKCGINLVYEEPKKQTTAKKVTVETDQGPIRTNTVHTSSSSANTNNNKKDDDDKWCWGCCICMFFLFIIFAIAGH